MLFRSPDLRGGVGAEEWRERFRRVREPLARLETYLETTEVSRPGRRQELEARRLELARSLEALEQEEPPGRREVQVRVAVLQE